MTRDAPVGEDGTMGYPTAEGPSATLVELAERARRLASSRSGSRSVLALAGAPGAGKSTLASAVVAALGGDAVLVPMDGFHLAQVELERLGRSERKGAPDTFDVGGYAALLSRVRHERSETIYAPEFRRDLEESIAGAIPVLPEHSLVVTEGNYLLLADDPWSSLRPYYDETWLVDLETAERFRRLVARHVAFGRSPAEARRWAEEVDAPNAARIAASSADADLVVPMAGLRLPDPATSSGSSAVVPSERMD